MAIGPGVLPVSAERQGEKGHVAMRRPILTLVLTVGLVAPAVASTPPRALGATPGTPPVWAAEFMAGKVVMTETLAVAQARRFDIMAAGPYVYRRFVGAMRAANPDLVLLAYRNGAFAQSTEGNSYPESWYERDASGNKVQSVGWGNYLMVPTNARWISDTVERCRSALVVSGYDGCFLDMLGAAPLFPSYVTGLPIDPATGLVWKKKDWLNATEAIAAQVQAAIAPATVWGNGLANGTPYFDSGAPTSRIMDGLVGAMAETFVRDPGAPIDSYRSEARWKQDVDMLVDVAARGEVVLTTTKVWVDGTQVKKDAWHRFALATFLLGYTPGKAYFSFRYNHGSTFAHPYWDVSIGNPTGPYAKVDGVYQRAFTNGRVLANPGAAAVTVSLGESFVTLDGNVVTSLTLQPHTGEVLTRA